MQLSGVKSLSATFASFLPACVTMGVPEEGKDIHQRVVKNGVSSNIVVADVLVDMYANCGSVEKAREVFDKMHDAETISWTAMIAGLKGSIHCLTKCLTGMQSVKYGHPAKSMDSINV